MQFRKLKANEIECRVAQVTKSGNLMLLLYKDARVDQRLLDEELGVFGWQREHQLIGDRLYCTVSVRNPDTGEWIKKQDVGTESYTEKEKGQASDSFKRACFNLGIGRELYTAPTIWINKGDFKATDKGGTYDRFEVKSIGYDSEGNINQLTIYNATMKRNVFEFKDGKSSETKNETLEDSKKNEEMKASVDPVTLPTEDGVVTKEQWERLRAEIKRTGHTEEDIYSKVKDAQDLTYLNQAQVIYFINRLTKEKSK